MDDYTIQALSENDPQLGDFFFFVDDDTFPENDHNGDNAERLVEALEGNTQVVSIDADMHVYTLTRPLQQVMAALGQLSHLSSIRCTSSGSYAVTIHAVAIALSAGRDVKTTRLTSLDLTNFLLADDDEEQQQQQQQDPYQAFVDALYLHPTLTSFNLAFGFSSMDGSSNGGHVRTGNSSGSSSGDATTSQRKVDDASRSLLPMIRALKTIPTLEWVRLDGAGFANSQALPADALGILCTNTCRDTSNDDDNNTNNDDKLTVVEVHDFDLSSAHLHALSQVLSTNTTVLKVLSLTCHSFLRSNKEDDMKWNNPMAQMLRTNCTLEKLFVNLKLLTGPISNESTSATKELHPNDFQAMKETFQAMEGNHTLKEFKIYGPSNQAPPTATTNKTSNIIRKKQSCDDAFRSLLYTNYTLERLELPYYSKHSIQEVQLHMKLNTIAERGRLVRSVGTTRGDWVNAFLHVQDDVSCVFHLLLLNPLLCAHNTNRGSSAGGRASISAKVVL